MRYKNLKYATKTCQFKVTVEDNHSHVKHGKYQIFSNWRAPGCLHCITVYVWMMPRCWLIKSSVRVNVLATVLAGTKFHLNPNHSMVQLMNNADAMVVNVQTTFISK
jgi:hypothetical protein